MEKYDRVKKLGSGSFGAAILVKRRTDRQLFVVKEVNLARMNPREREEARNECKVLQLLIHPNIVRYEEHFERRNILYIVMEYADGGDLHQKVVNQKSTLMREDTAMHYFVQMCLAIDYLHSRHILHRDLKAMNIFLTSNGTVKLGDFGISTILRNTMGMANTVCGTPYYFSPELCKNRPYNNKSDVWALGVVLYEMLALRHPFDASNLNQLMQRILKNPTPNVPSIYSREVKELVTMSLEKDHRKRPSVRTILQKEVVRRALVRLQGDLGAATNTNQRLQQIVAERISTGSNDYKNPNAQNNNNNSKEEEEKQRKKMLLAQQQQQQQQMEAAAKAKLQAQQLAQKAGAANNNNNITPRSRSPSPQQNALYNRGGGGAPAQQQQPQVVLHDQRARQPGGGNNNIINNNQQQQQQQRLPPPPPQQFNPKPHLGLAERMAEMERQRAARIRQLEQERKEAEEREKREIAEARKQAAARVAANRQRRAEELALREKREKDEREAYRKRQNQRGNGPISGRGGSKDSKGSNENNNNNRKNNNRRPSNVTPPVSGRSDQPVNVAQKMAAQGQQQQQQIPYPGPSNQGQGQDQRPAISNAYLAHLRDVQANRGGGGGGGLGAFMNNINNNNNNNNNNRQAAGDWVEREQMRRMGQLQQQGGSAMADIFGGGGVGNTNQQQQRNQQQHPKLDKDVEKWLADEQKKKWNHLPQQQPGQNLTPPVLGGANNINANNNKNLPPILNANNFNNNNNNNRNNNNQQQRPQTPPPSPSQHLRPNLRRKHGAVEPLPQQQDQQQQQPNQQRRMSHQEVAKRLPISPQQQALQPPTSNQQNNNNNNNNNLNDFRQQLDQAKKGQQHQHQQRDRSAPPVLSPVRQAPVANKYYGDLMTTGDDDEESGNMELGCEAELLEVVPSKSGDYVMGSEEFVNSDEEIEAHEQLVVQGQHNRYAEERRLKEYNAMGHHIQTLLAANNGKDNNNNNNDDNFKEMVAIEEEEDVDDDEDDDDDTDDENASNDEELGVVVDNNNNKPTPLQQVDQNNNRNNYNNNNNKNAPSHHPHPHHPHRQGTAANAFPLLHLCGGVAFSRWWQSVGNTQEEASALRAALVRRLKREEIVAQVIQLLNMACTSVNGTDGSLAVNMWKMVEPFVNQVRKVLKLHIVKTKLIENGTEDVIECFVDEVVQTASRVVFFEGYAHKQNINNNNKKAQQQQQAGVGVAGALGGGGGGVGGMMMMNAGAVPAAGGGKRRF